MGLPPSTMKDIDNLERRFSDDVLSITLSGPEHQHLSIVDVPGLFHSKWWSIHDILAADHDRSDTYPNTRGSGNHSRYDQIIYGRQADDHAVGTDPAFAIPETDIQHRDGRPQQSCEPRNIPHGEGC